LDALSDLSPNVWLGARVTDMSNVFGRLRPGVTSSDAARELQVIANDVRIRNSPDTLRAHPMRAQDFLAPREVRTVQVLFAAVGALLLIACANVANLLLARAWTRRREFAIRMGLGAGRARLVRQALTESVLIALAAGAAGVLIAWQGLHLIIALRPLSLDHLGEVRVETPVLFWTAVISVATGLLFGAASALFSGSRSVGDLLRNETRTSSSGVTTGRIRSTLIVVEIAMSLVLLVGTGLLLRSFVALQGTPLGFDPHGLVSIDIITPQALRQQDKAVVAQAIVEQLRATPGVRDAGVGTLPTAGWNLPGTIETDAGGVVRAVPVSQFMTTFIDKNYLRTCDIRLLEGRLPERPVAAPGSPSPSPMSLAAEVVVNRALARRIALGGHAVGVRIRKGTNMDGPVPASDAWSTIVGVVDDVRLPGARGDLHEFQVYGTVDRRISPTFVVRFESTPPNVESILRQAIHGVSPQIVARRARVADDYLREALAPTRFAMSLLGAFALVAMLLSAVGLYGVIAYGVSQRTREIGIRVALGAEPKNVTSLVLGNGLRLTAGGIILGAALAVGATRALGSMLFDVAPSDPVTFVIIAFGVGAVALAAAYIPARRALRIDPTEALRSE
jgi:putative ABC transport system permease protein